ncbi:MAG: GNAT family N-acetyltransferase [Myxococcota bacterium]
MSYVPVSMIEFTVHLVAWKTHKDELRAVREAVFVREQNVPLEEEWDGRDDESIHALARNSGGLPIGCGRLLPDGHVGRMAVLAEMRGFGVGAAILERLVDAARERGFAEIVLSSQVHAIEFYQRYGFKTEGDTYMDAGIPHRTMRRSL